MNDSVRQDVKFALRGFARNPWFTAAVVLTLGLGIGANSAIFSVVNGVILRPLPVRDADRLTVLAAYRGSGGIPGRLSRLDMEDYRSQADVFEDVAGYAMDFGSLAADNSAERVFLAYVSGNFFGMLGLQPAAGRLIQAGEGTVAGADPVLVLSHSYWTKRFSADPSVVGKAVRLNGRPFTIVGVAPEGFHGAYAFVGMDLFLPLAMMEGTPGWGNAWSNRGANAILTLARLKRGVSLARAQASVEVVGRRLAAQYPGTNKGVRPVVFRETHARPDPASGPVLPLVASVFLALVVLVLLVACVNVAGLLLARGTVRAREMTVRTALGAGRVRLVQQLVTESLLLSILGGAAGLLLGAWLSRVLSAIRLPNDLPIRLDFGFDWRVFAYVAAIVLLTGVVAGLLPAVRASATKPADVLREAGRSPGGSGRNRLRDLFIVSQVAGSLVILVVAGLFVRSLGSAHRLDLGFEPRGVMNFFMDPAGVGYDETRTAAFYRDLVARVRALPGVQSVSIAHSVPFGYYNISDEIEAEGQTFAPDEAGLVTHFNVVDDAYRQTMGIPLRRGRWLTRADEDGRRTVAVINETLARRLWPGQDAIGRRFRIRGERGPYLEVVGVAGDGRYNSIFEQPTPFFYAPHSLTARSLRVLHVRTAGAPERIAPLVRKEAAAIGPTSPSSTWPACRRRSAGVTGSSSCGWRRSLPGPSPCSRSASPWSASTVWWPVPPASERTR